MVNKKDLRAGIVKMREVAELLSGWADDMEALLEKTARKKGTGVSASVVDESAAPDVEVSSSSSAASASSPAVSAPPSYVELRGLLAAKSAAGYRTQVIALIHSYGVEKLSEVDESHYAELYQAVERLGDDHAG